MQEKECFRINGYKYMIFEFSYEATIHYWFFIYNHIHGLIANLIRTIIVNGTKSFTTHACYRRLQMICSQVQLQRRQSKDHLSGMTDSFLWFWRPAAYTIGNTLQSFTFQAWESINSCEGNLLVISSGKFYQGEGALTIDITTRKRIMEPFLNGTELRWEQNVTTDSTDGSHAVMLSMHAWYHTQTKC